MLGSVLAVASPASAAGSTDVSVSPTDKSVTAGNTVTYDIVVETADTGVGSYDFTLNSSNGTIATIQSVDAKGGGTEDITINDDGTSASVVVAFASIDAGEAVLATVTISGKKAGDATLDLSVDDVTDEDANSYTLEAVTDGTLTVNPNIDPKDGTEVSVTPESRTVTAVNETTYDISVAAAAGGIGSYGFTFRSSNPEAATITDIDLAGNPTSQTVDFAADDSSVTVDASGADTDDFDSVTVATVTVSGDAAGSADLTLELSTLENESGVAYNVTAVNNASITVEAGAGDEGTAVSLSPAEPSTSVNGASEIDVVVGDAPAGIAAWDVNVSVANVSTATITDVTLHDDAGTTDNTIASGGGWVSSASFGGSIAGGTDIAIMTVTVTGQAVGTVDLEVTVNDLTDADANSYTISETSGATLTVLSGPGDVTGNGDAALDPDNDGAFEDVNGDGRASITDVQVLFVNRNDPAFQDNAAFFDFSGDGRLSIVDVQSLFLEILSG